MSKIKVMVRKPEHSFTRAGEIIEIENSLKGIQEVIGGYLEAVPLRTFADKGIVAYCDEDGKFKDLDPCVALAIGNTITDFVAGNILFLGYKYVKGEGLVETGLTVQQVEFIHDNIVKEGYFTMESKGKLVPIPVIKIN